MAFPMTVGLVSGYAFYVRWNQAGFEDLVARWESARQEVRNSFYCRRDDSAFQPGRAVSRGPETLVRECFSDYEEASEAFVEHSRFAAVLGSTVTCWRPSVGMTWPARSR